jgi:hypothetical protein
MVLLHYHVVPGLGEDSRPRPDASAIRNDQVAQVAPANGDDLALAATHADRAIPPTPVEAVRAA